MEYIKTDAVVLGTGGAGMTAAITAAEGGAKVVVLEKRPFPGGASNTPVALGYVKNDPESQEKAFRVHMEWTLWTPNADLVRNYVNTSGEIPEWLEKMGAPVIIMTGAPPDMLSHDPPPGSAGPISTLSAHSLCMLKPVGRGHGGSQMIKTMVARAKGLGIDIRFATPAKKILRVGNRVTGVYAEDRSGNKIHVDAGAVVVATAGFNEEPEMIKKYSGFDFTLDRFGNCEEGNYFNLCPNFRHTGDGIKMAWEVGADKGSMGIPVWPHVPGPGIIGNVPWNMLSQLRIVQEQPYLWVNQDGKRFMNEEVISGRTTASGNLIARQNGKCAILIFDDDTRKKMEEEGVDKIYFIFPKKKLEDLEGDMRDVIAQGNKHAFIAESLEELAERAGIDFITLQRTVDEYNSYCEKGQDAQYGKNPKYLRPVKDGKFYGVRVFNTAYGTSGGIRISGKTEAMTKEGKVIPGLYAAGDIILGEFFGDMVNQGIHSIGFAMTTGRIAGKSLLKYLNI